MKPRRWRLGLRSVSNRIAKLREEVAKRDGYGCWFCGHKDRLDLWEPDVLDPILLCEVCVEVRDKISNADEVESTDKLRAAMSIMHSKLAGVL